MDPEAIDQRDLQRSALLVANLAALVVPLMASAVNIALPAIGRDLSLPASDLGWVNLVFLLAAAVGMVPLGRLADIHGRRKWFIRGMVGFTLSSLLAALAPGGAWLLIARAGQGLSCAGIFATSLAILSVAFPPGRRGRAIGINTAVVYIGLAGGPMVGGLMTRHLGWRSIFMLAVLIGAWAVWAAAFRLRHEWAPARGETFDLIGSLLYALGLVVLMLGVSSIVTLGGLVAIMAGLACLGFFVWWQGRAAQPVFDLSLFSRNRVFAFSSLAALLNYGAVFAVSFLLSLYLQRVKNLAAHQAGLVLMASPVIMALISPLAGRLSDRVQPRLVASGGMALTALGLGLLTLLQADTPLPWLVACLLLAGCGFGFFSSPNMNAIMSSLPPHQFGLASGSVGTMRLLGQMLSMGVATCAFAWHLGRISLSQTPPGALLAAGRSAFFVMTALCIVGLAASLARGKLKQG